MEAIDFSNNNQNNIDSINPLFLDKEEFLQKTNGGFELFRYIMNHYGQELKNGNNFQMKNPFYKDSHASLSISQRGDKFFFKDFGDESYSGDVFDFAGHYYNLNPKFDFPKIIEYACRDLNLKLREVTRPNNNFKIFENGFSENELNFWKQFGITPEILFRFNVVSILKIEAQSNEGHNYIIKSFNDNPIFAYKIGDSSYKIYRPLEKEKKYKFRWYGGKLQGFIFGLNQLPDNEETLIVTGGEKDVLCLSALGYNSICLNSETQCHIDETIINDLKNRFKHIIVLYDIDSTGMDSSTKLCEKYGLLQATLPQELTENNSGKDISDYIKAVNTGYKPEIFSIETIHELINDVIQPNQVDKIPTIPSTVYEKLPQLLQKVCENFENPAEKDIILLGALGVISGCLPCLYGIYDRLKVYPNIYIFILGQAGSGKGVIKLTKILGENIHNYLLDESLQNINEFKIKKTEIKKYDCEEIEVEPVRKMLFIPANSSSTGALELLNNNCGMGIMFETEGDTLTNTFKTEYGNYSDSFRKAAHHETISYYRRGNKEHVEIKEPKLSVILCGTHNQVKLLIPDTENGLFSRFIFYIFDTPFEFKNINEKNAINLSNLFTELSIEVFDMYNKFSHEVEFILSEEQWQTFQNQFKDWLDELLLTVGEGSVASIHRLGLSAFRIMMILSALRNQEVNNQLVCNDNDFQIALEISFVIKEHVKKLLAFYPKIATIVHLRDKKMELYNVLPDEFKREEALVLNRKIKLSIASLDRLLRNQKLFIRLGYGRYQKISKILK